MDHQQSYLNPRIPFTGCIQGGVCEGKVITLTGRVLPGAERFHVNLQCGSGGSPDIALHFNPRYTKHSGFVVLNTLTHSCWGSEERSRHTPLPRGSAFILTFLINRDSYSVIVNGAHFMEYLHRISTSRVNVISVDGGVEIQAITFQNPATSCVQQTGCKQQTSCVQQTGFVQQSFSAPQLSFGQQGWRGRGGGRGGGRRQKHVIQDQHHAGFSQAPPPYSPPQAYVVPYKTVIQGGLYPGKAISIQGLVNHDANRFSINLRFNSGIAFHFNPRFNENIVVRNSQIQDRWGAEERTGGMPFYRGHAFMVNMVCDTQCYKILINGVQMFTYNHRHFLFQQIDILEVEGNISLSSVSV